jgi:hypothetical protein
VGGELTMPVREFREREASVQDGLF